MISASSIMSLSWADMNIQANACILPSAHTRVNPTNAYRHESDGGSSLPRKPLTHRDLKNLPPPQLCSSEGVQIEREGSRRASHTATLLGQRGLLPVVRQAASLIFFCGSPVSTDVFAELIWEFVAPDAGGGACARVWSDRQNPVLTFRRHLFTVGSQRNSSSTTLGPTQSKGV
jgi:hypothetical protein